MPAKLIYHVGASARPALQKHTHYLFVLPVAKVHSPAWPAADVLDALLKRRRAKPTEMAKSPQTGNLKSGALASWIMFDPAKIGRAHV